MDGVPGGILSLHEETFGFSYEGLPFMRWVPIVLLAIPLVTIAISRTPAETALEVRRAQLSAALEQEWEYQLQAHPEMATYIGDNRFNDRVSDYSAKFFADDLEHAKQTLRNIEPIATTGFPELIL